MEEERATKRDRSPKVVVVGAGFAGVGVARRLRQLGINDVTILEAHDRPGGRVQNVVLDDGFVELGAQYLHGETEIYETARREGLLREDGENGDEDDDDEDDEVPDTLIQYKTFTFRLPGGEALEQEEVNYNLKILEELTLRAVTAEKDGVQDSDDVNVSVGDFFRTLYPEYMARMKGDQRTKELMIRWFEEWNVLDSAATVDQLSLPGTARYVYEKGSGVQETKTGLFGVLQKMLDEALPKDPVVLNKPVKSVHWASKPGGFVEGRINNNDPLLVHSPHGDIELETASGAKYDHIYRSVGELKDRIAESEQTHSANLREDHPSNVVPGCSYSSVFTPPDTASGAKHDDRSVGELKDRIIESEHTPSVRLPGGHHYNAVPGCIRSYPLTEKNNEGCGSRLSPLSGKSNREYRAAISCEDGEVFFADYVVVTSSVGFLKERPDFFIPNLPETHQKAIHSAGFADIAKIFLIWDFDKSTKDKQEKFRIGLLGGDMDGVNLLWPDGQNADIKASQTAKRTSKGKRWYEDICMMEFIETYPFCLLVWVHGEGAIIMESLPMSEVKDVCYELLILFLDKKDLPPPSRILRSEWHENPYTQGAYSYLATGVPLESHNALSQPIPSAQDPLLQLAGEACSKGHYSTAHGALYSGYSAADVIFRHWNHAVE